MRTLAHLSDLHFGRVDEQLIEPLISAVAEVKPDLVAISGDLTQRARSHQFREARVFLDALPQPQIVVPGNHDVPLHNVFTRFLQPLDKYKRHITDDLQPVYVDEEIAVVGVNTARSLTFKGGRINEDQIARIREELCGADSDVIKIVVTHHPFDLPEGYSDRDLVGRAQMAMTGLADCGADLFLAGHLHVSHTGHTAKRYNIRGHSALVVQAGTASSTRGRGEANSFNVIRIHRPNITVERLTWQPASSAFALSGEENFRHTSDGWVRLPEERTD
jgi:3',5'-cyclic AMP phosphodiesterase CpdA